VRTQGYPAVLPEIGVQVLESEDRLPRFNWIITSAGKCTNTAELSLPSGPEQQNLSVEAGRHRTELGSEGRVLRRQGVDLTPRIL